ncbi:MAG: PAM68 family protein [Microcoleus sp. PH2017_15_JOR_U_A]|uniref:PAM68 family protein n=1 Tax=unclassified Microcoleus TaxID=2642155 RepID=UPI001D2D7EB7|nr:MULTISPECIES: PAM68 family protein [unclassified Microcoleus]MCC3474210.1 PAM68 family protein [Microcoleus sp. PH2017_13_LAR_U_A]MCC3485296.1 PAM68 family protein [Microcoleus sp. PH2017_14_LAR_D_A]MCC3499676.1 PAM68 family protein [Microcoleus sp. PH2017_15_JOR_U_A]MCC3600251.1 PAM68 family protein [Microcoleus sp. PH2017_26_ELK_O_A]MCC3625176.1 PAM68 family protein [Microcoleus sp. PH2017_36_ELK_O_B]
MSSEPPTQRLPFEPASNRKKTAKKPPEAEANPVTEEPKSDKQPKATKKTGPQAQSIPEAVSKRMISRIAVFCGAPTLLGISTFFVSYLIVSKGWFDLPNTAVLLVSMGCFGLGVLGLSYGVLSASWDEEASGSTLGWEEFNTNFGRMREAWRDAKSKN